MTWWKPGYGWIPRMGWSVGLNYPPGPPVYEGLVATRLHVAQTAYSGNHWLMARSNHVATDDITSLKVAFGNFYIQDGHMQEFGNDNAATVTASIEYPAGTFTQLLFSGSASGPIPAVSSSGGTTEVGVRISDYSSVTIPKGERFWVRFYFTNPGGIIHTVGQDTANGDLLDFGGTPGAGQDKTLGGTIVDAGGNGYSAGPVAIIAQTTKASVIAIGDSICYGQGDAAASPTDWARGSICRGIPATIPTLNLASSGSSAGTFLSMAASRAALFPYCSHGVLEHASNDIFTAPFSSAAQVAGYNQALAAAFPSHVKKLLATCLPRSTGSWSTLGGQTVTSYEPVRTAYNAMVRGGTIAGFADYLESADQVESSRDSGKWIVSPSPPYTADGIHPNAAGNGLTSAYMASVAATKFAYP